MSDLDSEDSQSRGRLEPPILTTPQRINPWSPFSYGGIEVEGARKSTYTIEYSCAI